MSSSQYSLSTLLKLTTGSAVLIAMMLWIVRPSTHWLPVLLPTPSEFAMVGLVFAPLCFIAAVFAYVAYGIASKPAHISSILHMLPSVFCMMSMYGNLKSHSAGQTSSLLVERCLEAMVCLSIIGIAESVLRNSFRVHAIANASLWIATFCVYLYWCATSTLKSIL